MTYDLIFCNSVQNCCRERYDSFGVTIRLSFGDILGFRGGGGVVVTISRRTGGGGGGGGPARVCVRGRPAPLCGEQIGEGGEGYGTDRSR